MINHSIMKNENDNSNFPELVENSINNLKEDLSNFSIEINPLIYFIEPKITSKSIRQSFDLIGEIPSEILTLNSKLRKVENYLNSKYDSGILTHEEFFLKRQDGFYASREFSDLSFSYIYQVLNFKLQYQKLEDTHKIKFINDNFITRNINLIAGMNNSWKVEFGKEKSLFTCKTKKNTSYIDVTVNIPSVKSITEIVIHDPERKDSKWTTSIDIPNFITIKENDWSPELDNAYFRINIEGKIKNNELISFISICEETRKVSVIKEEIDIEVPKSLTKKVIEEMRGRKWGGVFGDLSRVKTLISLEDKETKKTPQKISLERIKKTITEEDEKKDFLFRLKESLCNHI